MKRVIKMSCISKRTRRASSVKVRVDLDFNDNVTMFDSIEQDKARLQNILFSALREYGYNAQEIKFE